MYKLIQESNFESSQESKKEPNQEINPKKINTRILYMNLMKNVLSNSK